MAFRITCVDCTHVWYQEHQDIPDGCPKCHTKPGGYQTMEIKKLPKEAESDTAEVRCPVCDMDHRVTLPVVNRNEVWCIDCIQAVHALTLSQNPRALEFRRLVDNNAELVRFILSQRLS